MDLAIDGLMKSGLESKEAMCQRLSSFSSRASPS
jgi:hypothetical protein